MRQRGLRVGPKPPKRAAASGRLGCCFRATRTPKDFMVVDPQLRVQRIVEAQAVSISRQLRAMGTDVDFSLLVALGKQAVARWVPSKPEHCRAISRMAMLRYLRTHIPEVVARRMQAGETLGFGEPVDVPRVYTIQELSPQQRSVVLLVAQGLRLREAARFMGVHTCTAWTHLNAAHQRLHVHRRADLVRMAFASGLIKGIPDEHTDEHPSVA